MRRAPRSPKALLLTLATVGAVLGGGSTSAFGAGLVAPASVCPEKGIRVPLAAQQEQMLCLVNHARRQWGVPALEETAALERSAADKARDIFRCDSFSHHACGREFNFWMRAAGYLEGCWRAGENLAYGSGRLGRPVAIFRAWLRSPTHRANLLGDYAQTGLSLRVGRLEGSRGVRLWTQHFGSRC